MSIIEFLGDPDWDSPFFKRLAHNDTGQAAGHQAGMVLPKDLRRFLPSLDESATTPLAPTTDRDLRAEMFLGMAHVADRLVRYQFQTWGGTRSPESRITDGFQPLRDSAAEGDLIVFQRRVDVFDRFRLILIRQGTPEFNAVDGMTLGRRWGALSLANPPVTQQQLSQAATDVLQQAQGEFQLVRPIIPRVETRQTRIARSAVFRARVRSEYDRRCAVSGIGIATPNLFHEVESAHVVPVEKGGTDDVRNGLCLTRTLHWAFDRGLFGVRPDRTIYLPGRARRMTENSFLLQFESRPINEARTAALQVHADAFRWHMNSLVRQWD